MSKLTPTQSQIRSAWIGQRWEQAGQLRSEGSDDEFDRFLAGVRADFAEQIRSTIGAYSEEGVSALDSALACIERAGTEGAAS